jgi:hypothetical protein
MGMDVRHSIERSWHPRRWDRATKWNGCSSAGSFGATNRAATLFSLSQNCNNGHCNTGYCNTRPIARSVAAVVRLGSVSAFAFCEEEDDPDYYGILGISGRAGSAEVKAAFRRLAKALHPDCSSGNKAAHQRFLAVQRAYTVLCNADRRADYDLYLRIRDTGAQIDPVDISVGADATPPRRGFWRRAVRATAATIAFAVVFGAGALLWQRDTSTLHSDRTAGAGLIAANATNAPAISHKQLAEALYGSEAILYSSESRLHHDTVTAAVGHDSLPSVRLANLGEPATLGADASFDRPARSINMTALIEGLKLVESGNRELARGNFVVARKNFTRAADHGLAVAAVRLADTFEARTVARLGGRGVKPNPQEARKWRERALELSTEIAKWSVEP